MFGVDAIVAEHLEVFLRDMYNQSFDEIKSWNTFVKSTIYENNHKYIVVERRKKKIEKNKVRLEQRQEELRLIAPYVEMVKMGQVDYEYRNEVCYDIFTGEFSQELVKVMKFDNGDMFIPDGLCIGKACIKNKEGEVIVGDKSI